MKIVNSKQQAMRRFFDIDIGTVFMLDDGKCYMKTDSIEATDPLDIYNAVRLNDGEMCEIFDSQIVILVDCELVIK